ncbi:hypothetical protein EJ06DRAFT_115558 [Trichodelitschia bisporula]|uniref:Chromo domain-containing protein n=1 Tax=Trichodelitschia bisporula TaxID=703511 RepID=A0A6G1HRL7_9PEZI|nr:hypothetical protein EJ06DRAFT_115558 [Trichodelitschia bisporula]
MSSLITHPLSTEAEWEVEEVLNSRVFKGKKDPLTGKREYLQYMVKWRGWPDDRKWYDWDDLVGCPALIAAFHRTYRSKPGPHESFKKYTSETWDAWEKDVEDNIAARLALC